MIASLARGAALGLLICASRLAAAQLERQPDREEREPYRLLVPYPVTGSRALQDPDRMTRSYRALAPHAPGAVTELLAQVTLRALGGRAVRARVPGTAHARGPQISTLVVHYPTLLVLAGEETGIEDPPHDALHPAGRLAWIATLTTIPYVLVCLRERCSDRGNSVDTALRSAPRSFASTGEGSVSHRLALALMRKLDRAALHIPYRGGTTAWNALLTAEVDIAFTALPVAYAHIRSNTIAALGITGTERFERLPELHTLHESGLPGFERQGWFAVFAAKHIAGSDLAEFRVALQDFLRHDHVRGALLDRGVAVEPPRRLGTPAS